MVMSTIDWVRRINPAFPIPDVSPVDGSRVMVTWDRGERHLEAEVLPNGIVEFFFRDRDHSELWGEDFKPLEASAAQTKELREAIHRVLTA